ncbi:hypothetical protein NQT62_04460 [Limnobacter humi]|uniref:HD domain-containing protein n=1 Tax=Limnobacter humi TaxID=1778671 RepID=A0ABT1WDU2_9BURK|nr:hypothetical protein [Limnobacter humi]MCQ8895695.1 hypothetical protein [Limnobacter humi]
MNSQNLNTSKNNTLGTACLHVNRYCHVDTQIKSAYRAHNPEHHFQPVNAHLLGGGSVLSKASAPHLYELKGLQDVLPETGVTVGAFGSIFWISTRIIHSPDKAAAYKRQHALIRVPLYCAVTGAFIASIFIQRFWKVTEKIWQSGEIVHIAGEDEAQALKQFPAITSQEAPPQCSVPNDLNPYDYAGLLMPKSTAIAGQVALVHQGLNLHEICMFLSAVFNHLNPEDKALYMAVLGQGTRWDKFLTYPASLKNHHSYERGLLVHTAETVAHVLLAVQRCNEVVDVSLTLLAALMHDLGKVHDYICLAHGTYIGNQNCQLIGHEQTMLKWIATACATQVTYPEARQIELEHAICAVKRQHDQSGVRKRKTVESFVMHEADCKSARTDCLKQPSILVEAGFVSATTGKGV